MATTKTPAGPRRRAVIPIVAIAVVLGVVAGAVIVDGYDSRDIPPVSTAVWVTRADNQYARVNTDLGELDTIRSVENPVDIVQSGSQSMVFSQGYSQAWPIDPAYPRDFDADATTGSSASAAPTTAPAGTTHVTASRDYVAYLTGLGDVYLSAYPEPGAARTGAWILEPFADAETAQGEDPPHYAAAAIAVDDDGTVAMYSAAEGAVRIYDANSAKFVTEPEPVASAPEAEGLAMTLADGRWVLYSAADGRLWAKGLSAPLATGLGDGAALQATASGRPEVYLADARSLVRISLDDSAVTTVTKASGTPAQPVNVAGVAYAAWIKSGLVTVWSSEAEARNLELPPDALGDDQQSVQPVFRSNGDRVVLTEATTGLVWTLPDGALIPLEDWAPLDDDDKTEGTVTVDDVVEQEPPVAIADDFGVRRGATARLPLLYNDSDPNKKDGLSISPESLSPLDDDAFGTVGLVDNNQTAVVRVAAESGETSFTYAASDGSSLSSPAAVTLHVVPEEQQTAPEWCGVESCQQEWPAPQVVPGGFVEVPVITGWVDPEGDPVALIDAVVQDPNAPVTVVPTADGTVAIRHQDPNAGSGTIQIDVTVSDSLGATTTKTLELRVTSAPPLSAKPIVVAAGVSDPRQVDITEYVEGGSGSYQLVDATASQGGADFAVSPIPASNTVEVSAAAPGDYVATYTVEDTQTLAQQTAVLRMTIADVSSALSLPPLTAFVRPLEDSTLDILASAQNTTGRVLMITAATAAEANLGVSVVGSSYLRLSGTTADGMPGRVGVVDVTIGDGAGSTASTQVTVFLLAASHSSKPIAVPDAVTVRAGTQVDLPVLANDISPRGERVVLHPDIEGSGTDGELAFASGDSLRYLAPTEPGVYTLRYTTYLENSPSRYDAAPVTVTVLPAGSNRAPEPPTLVGRVLAGQSVTIPFDAVGVDPDGDAVTLVDASQPKPGSGVASVASTGAALVYRAPAGGVDGGQVEFTYTVRDENGATGDATVRVGVLPADAADVAPVTYSDHLNAQLGSGAPLTVTPLTNDVDPMNGTLKLISVRPNATPGTQEFTRLEALLDDAAISEGRLILKAGDIEGSHSYVYMVESSTTLSTAEGLIVVNVATEASPSQLTVTDTSLTASTRHDLADGIDVVTGKVTWQTGDPSQLELTLWGDASAGFSVNDWEISGDLPATRTVIPFSLSGTDYSGNEVQTFGFLRIPSFDDMRLQVKGNETPTEVGEDESVELDILSALDIGADDVVEVSDAASFAVQRANAQCTRTSGDSATYAAGREAPWVDTCSVSVRLAGQSAWSIVALPLTIVPKDPQAILTPASHTVSPGDEATIDMVDTMLSWEGGRAGDIASLNLQATHSGPAFEVVSDSSGTLTVTARADAVPGTRERVAVSSDAYGGLSSSITLVVGAAHPDAPKGATFTTQCDVSTGRSCTITAIGRPGEYDPFAGKTGAGLTIKTVGTSGSVACPVATITKGSDTTLVATWPPGARPPGGECAVPYTVVDAQGRPGQGLLNLDVQGFPATPSTVTTVAYTGTSVTLQVELGPASEAHPSVTTVAIYRDGKPAGASCEAAGQGAYRCVVNRLTSGERARYTARAVNSVGESGDTSAVESWAYEAPRITNIKATSVYEPGTTDTRTGAVTIAVSSPDDTQSFIVAGTGQTIPRSGLVTNFTTSLPVGTQRVELIPVSKFAPPITGSSEGDKAAVTVTVVGAPMYSGGVSTAVDGTTVTVNGGSLIENYSSEPTSQVWFAWRTGSTPSCTMDGSRRAQVSGSNATTSTSNVISGLDPRQVYTVAICGSNGFGAAVSNTATAYTWVAPNAPSGNTNYKISASPNPNGNVFLYGLQTAPSLAAYPGTTLYYFYNGGGETEQFDPGFTPGVEITAKYCTTGRYARCGDEIDIDPVAGTPSAKVQVTFPSQCVETPSATDVVFLGVQPSQARVDISEDGTTYILTWTDPPYTGLQNLSYPITRCATPDPTPDPTPSP